MIKASHHPLMVWFLKHYARQMIYRHFRKVYIEGDVDKPLSSILIVSNHFSWWDGFFIHYLNYKLWQKKFHAMMLEEQLKSRKFLSNIGCFSIQYDRSSTLESMRYAQNLLQSPDNMLLMYPQGEIQSQMEYPLHFKPGAEHLINTTQTTTKMVVVLTDYFSHPKPSVSFYIKDYKPDTTQTLNEAFNSFLKDCIQAQSQKARLV